MSHNIVSEFTLFLLCQLEINIINPVSHLFDLFIGDLKTKILFHLR